MATYYHLCKWCKRKFASKRPHTLFCKNNCKLRSHRFGVYFDLVAEMLPEAEVEVLISNLQHLYLLIHLWWYRVEISPGIFLRYADVHICKVFSWEVYGKMGRTNFVFYKR